MTAVIPATTEPGSRPRERGRRLAALVRARTSGGSSSELARRRLEPDLAAGPRRCARRARAPRPTAGRSPSTRNGLPIDGIGPTGRADLDDEPVVRELRVLDDLGDVVHGAAGDPRRLEQLEPLVRGPGARTAPRGAARAGRGARPAPRSWRSARRRAGRAGRRPRRRARASARARGRRSRRAARRRPGRGRRGRRADAACPCAPAPPAGATRGAGSSRASRPSCRRARRRPARPRRSRRGAASARQRRHGRVARGADVADRDPDARRLGRRAGDGDQPGLALHDEVVGVLVGVRPVRAVAGDVDVDDVRPERAHGLLPEAHAVGPAGRVVLEEDVAPLDQALDRRPALRVLDVERDAPLAAVDPDEAARETGGDRVPGARDVAAVRAARP